MLFFNSKKKQVNLPSKIPLRNTIQGIIAIASCKKLGDHTQSTHLFSCSACGKSSCLVPLNQELQPIFLCRDGKAPYTSVPDEHSKARSKSPCALLLHCGACSHTFLCQVDSPKVPKSRRVNINFVWLSLGSPCVLHSICLKITLASRLHWNREPTLRSLEHQQPNSVRTNLSPFFVSCFCHRGPFFSHPLSLP